MLHMSKRRGNGGSKYGSGLTLRPKTDVPPDVASNLRRIRHDRGYSLENLAKLSGVSRAMLGQIETGKSVPTVTLIWKVSKALGVPATTLIANPVEAQAIVISKGSVRTVLASAGRFQIRSYSREDFGQPFEFSEIHIIAGHRENVPPLPIGASATLLVMAGVIEVAIGGEPPARLTEGSAILFQADIEHSFFNTGTTSATAFLVVATARNDTA